MKEYWDDFPVDLTKALLNIVALMQEQGTFSGHYAKDTSHGDVDVSYIIMARKGTCELTGPGDVLLSLEVLGLIVREKINSSDGAFSLTPEAVSFAHYKRSWRIDRWWQRTIVPNATAIGAVMTSLIFVVLAGLQIYQALQALHVIP